MNSFNEAFIETRNDAQKWERFVGRVLKGSANSETEVKYGPGRVDAFGRIYNKVALLLNSTHEDGNPPDAPVSVPFIWRAPQFDKVQYNGIAPKVPVFFQKYDVGALGRNTGEVIGVFADVVPTPRPGLANGFESSVHVHNLTALEECLATLRPPKWPASLFADPVTPEKTRKVRDGENLYKTHCLRRHALVDRTNLTTIITAEMNLFDGSGKHSRSGKKLERPGTDPWMACNAFDYAALTGHTFVGLRAALGRVARARCAVFSQTNGAVASWNSAR